jgi:hypothetical protein
MAALLRGLFQSGTGRGSKKTGSLDTVMRMPRMWTRPLWGPGQSLNEAPGVETGYLLLRFPFGRTCRGAAALSMIFFR